MSGIEPLSPVLAGRFFTTGPPGKPCSGHFEGLSHFRAPTGSHHNPTFPSARLRFLYCLRAIDPNTDLQGQPHRTVYFPENVEKTQTLQLTTSVKRYSPCCSHPISNTYFPGPTGYEQRETNFILECQHPAESTKCVNVYTKYIKYKCDLHKLYPISWNWGKSNTN